MKLRITAYAVDAFRFACIMSFINVLLSRFGIYGTADKLIFNEYGLSPWISEVCNLALCGLLLWAALKMIGKQTNYPDFTHTIPLWSIFLIDGLGCALLLLAGWILTLGLSSSLIFAMIELLIISLSLFSIHKTKYRRYDQQIKSS